MKGKTTRRWQEWELEYLRSNYQNKPMGEMMEQLDRSFSAVTTMAVYLKLTGGRYSLFNGQRRHEGEPVKPRAKRTVKPDVVGNPHRLAKKAAPEKPDRRMYKTRDAVAGKVPVRLGPRTWVYMPANYTAIQLERATQKLTIV